MLYQKLRVWQKAIDLGIKVYELTKHLPDDEKFGLSKQIKRSSVSIASNIAEGHGRESKKSFINFLKIARGSLFELQTQLVFCRKLKLIDEEKIKDLEEEFKTLDKMLYGLIRKI